jgi:hypothetical protein
VPLPHEARRPRNSVTTHPHFLEPESDIEIVESMERLHSAACAPDSEVTAAATDATNRRVIHEKQRRQRSVKQSDQV